MPTIILKQERAYVIEATEKELRFLTGLLGSLSNHDVEERMGQSSIPLFDSWYRALSSTLKEDDE